MLHMNSGTMTRLLKRMEADGLIVRTRDSQDERRVLIDLTQKGCALRSEAMRVPARLAEGLDIDQASVILLRDKVHELVAALHNRSPLKA